MRAEAEPQGKRSRSGGMVALCSVAMVAITAAAIHLPPDRLPIGARPPTPQAEQPRDWLAERGIDVDLNAAVAAAVRGDVLVLELLRQRGLPLTSSDGSPGVVLANAIRSGSLEATGWLLEHAGGTPPIDRGDGPSPLGHAVATGEPAMVDLVARYSSGDQIDRVLLAAIGAGAVEVVETLLENGAAPEGHPASAKSPLGVAVAARAAAVIGMLAASGADLDRPAAGGSTPLELALAGGDAGTFALLLDHGAAPHPALARAAADRGAVEILRLLADRGAGLDCPSADGDTPLTAAVRGGRGEVVAALLEGGADPMAAGREGQPALPLAVALRSAEMVRHLLEAGVDPDARLAQPASEPFRELVDNKTMDFYLTRDSRFTPLMLAAAIGNPDCIRALLSHGASRGTHTRRWKRYPISFASQAKHTVAQQLLCGYDPELAEARFEIVISLSKQRATLLKDGAEIDSSPVSTGRRGYRTPTGEYVVTHKHRHHRSSLYNAAPMPYFMRFSCGAFGTHSGHCPGYPASHGCIRMPAAKARAFFTTCPTGTVARIVD